MTSHTIFGLEFALTSSTQTKGYLRDANNAENNYFKTESF